ncbi:MAG: hypothetical protein R3F20_04135 [Planctomycetota bacterium]
MTFITRLLLLSTTLVLALGAAAAQDGEAPPKAKLSDKDIEALQPLFAAAMDEPNVAKHAKELNDALTAWSEKNGKADPLSDVSAWTRMHAAYREEKFDKRAKGPGSLQEGEVFFKRKGELYQIEYAYRFPRSYDRSKPMPIVLCFHDEKSDGKEYIKRVWLTGKANQELADQFILVAPTLVQKTKSTKIMKGDYKGETTAEHEFQWFDIEQANYMLRPLKEVQQLLNTDPSKVFVEGAGTGAAVALHLAAIYGLDTFAGVVARQGTFHPDHMNVIDGLQDFPVMFAQRPPHAKEKGDGDARWKAWQATKALVAERKWQKVTIEESEGPVESLNPAAEAGQQVEPFIEANAKIAEFYANTTAVANPKKFRFVTDNPIFVSAAFLKLVQHDITLGATIDVTVEVDDKAGAIRLTGQGFQKISLFLNDEIIDLDRSIEVTVNGVRWAYDRQARSLTEMLKGMRQRPLSEHRMSTVVLTVKPEEGTAPAGEGEQPAGASADGEEKKDG